MKIAGHTSLKDVSGMPREIRAHLEGLWVDSVEEYVSLLAATAGLEDGVCSVPGNGIAARLRDFHPTATALFTAPQLLRLTKATPGGGLGCALDPQVFQQFQLHGSLRPDTDAGRIVFGEPLPPSARLMDQLPAVKNQGSRGTCVAFSSVALREFLAKKVEVFSEQFLYWACKEMDGLPGAGTFIHTAMAALENMGVCRGSTWPYHPEQDSDNESQGPPPPNAEHEALGFKIPHTYPVEPSLIEHYKRVLSGRGKGTGAPIVFAVLVFNSWYQSPETHRTGKITMPLPGEQPLPGGHAMCVAGYVDDAAVPGGGYFIVRNSWGSEWAAASPEAPGHAMMPYAYVARYAVEAFSGDMGEATLEPTSVGGKTQSLPEVLSKPERDIEGRRWLEGTSVLRDLMDPAQFMVDSPENRRRYELQDRTWSASTRAQVWFPAPTILSASCRERIESSQTVCNSYMAGIKENINRLVGAPLPEKRLPWYLQLLAWEPTISRIEEINLQPYLLDAIKKESGVPAGIPWPTTWEELIGGVNRAKLYTITGLGAKFHVVAGFLTPVRMAKGQEPRLVEGFLKTIQLLEDTYRRAIEEKGVSKPTFTFFAIGSQNAIPLGTDELSASEHWFVLSHPVDKDIAGNVWENNASPHFSTHTGLRDLLDALKPETRQQRVLRVEHQVKALLDESYGGNITLQLIAKKTGDSFSQIRAAFLALQGTGEYVLTRTNSKELAIERRQGSTRPGISDSDGKNSWIVRHFVACFLMPLVSVALFELKDLLRGNPVNWHVLLAMLPLAYLGGFIERHLKRYTE